jgi:hypothetical protein
LRVHDHHRVVIPGPIEAGVVGNVFPGFHRISFPVWHRGAVMRQTDTRSLAGYGSLRRWDGRRQTDRCA